MYPKPDRSDFVPNRRLTDEWIPEGDLGSYSGMLEDDRPYLAEAWFTEGITLTTFFFSTLGIEDPTAESLLRLLAAALESYLIPLQHRRLSAIDVKTIRDSSGHEMFSLTFVAGLPE
jgi:hypothetical protein